MQAVQRNTALTPLIVQMWAVNSIHRQKNTSNMFLSAIMKQMPRYEKKTRYERTHKLVPSF